MKTIKYLLFAFMAAFVFSGCSDDPTYTPGEGEDPNSYGVYFPSQENAGTVELDPAAETELVFKVVRKNFNDEITVPVEVSGSEAGIFVVSEIKFEEGQEESTFTVTFPTAEVGKTYSCSILITDKKYALNYGTHSTGLDFNVTRVQWNNLEGPNGEKTGKWRDELFTAILGAANIKENGIPNAEKDVVIQERADMPGYYRIKDIYDAAYMKKIAGVNYSDVLPVSTYTIIDARDKDKVWFPVQPAGFAITAYDDGGAFVIVSFCKENYPSIASATLYGKLENGILTFPAKAVMLSLPSKWEATSYYKVNSDIMRLMLPGAKDYDYQVSFTSAPSVDGKVAIAASLGKDVAKVKYAYFEGALSTSVIASKSTDIDAGTVASQEITASGTIEAVMKETGIYTLVGNSYNAAGELQKYGAVTFGYIKQGESKPVVLSVRTELTWEKEAQGHTPENSIKGILYGENIESGYYGLIKTSVIQGMSEAQLTALVKGGNAISADYLAKINGTGWAPFFTKLEKGTSYTLLVWADNGYNGKLFAVEQTTQGEPSPLDVIYTFDDALGGVPKADLFGKTWNYYAVDASGASASREYLGTVTVAENPNDGVDPDDGSAIDYIDIKGLTALGSDKNYTGNDIVKASWSSPGLVYPTASNDLGKYGTYYVTNFFQWEEKPTGLHTIDYALIGIYVREGIIAFVPNDQYVTMGYTFTGMYFGAFKDAGFTDQAGYLTKLKHLLLVDPAFDPNAKAAAAVAKTLGGLKAATNYVELRGPALTKAVWNEQAAKPRVISGNPLEGEVSSQAVTPMKSTYSPVIVRPAGNGTIQKMPLHTYME